MWIANLFTFSPPRPPPSDTFLYPFLPLNQQAASSLVRQWNKKIPSYAMTVCRPTKRLQVSYTKVKILFWHFKMGTPVHQSFCYVWSLGKGPITWSILYAAIPWFLHKRLFPGFDGVVSSHDNKCLGWSVLSDHALALMNVLLHFSFFSLVWFFYLLYTALLSPFSEYDFFFQRSRLNELKILNLQHW